jgi:hypothetical protein
MLTTYYYFGLIAIVAPVEDYLGGFILLDGEKVGTIIWDRGYWSTRSASSEANDYYFTAVEALRGFSRLNTHQRM